MDIILSAPNFVKSVYVHNGRILSVEENPEVKPQKGIVALLNAPDVKRARVFAFSKAEINKNAIFEEISNYYNTTDFIYDVFDWKNYYIVTVVSRKIYDLVQKIFNPTQIVPFDFVVLWNIRKQIKKPLVAFRGGLYYFLSATDICITHSKEEVEPFIIPGTVVVDSVSATEFPNLVVQSVKRHWKVDRRIDTSLVDDDVRDIEFLLHSPINLLKESVTIANDVERNKELQYIMSITSAVLIYLAILIISPFVTANVRLPISSVSYNIPTNLQRIDTSFSFDQFIYRKAYPYTLYEAYDSKGQQAAVFVVPQEAVKWAQEFPDYTVYKVVYDQTKMLSKEYFAGKKADESEVTATTTVPTTSTTATVPIVSTPTTTTANKTATTSSTLQQEATTTTTTTANSSATRTKAGGK